MASLCTEQLRFTAEKTLSSTCFPQIFFLQLLKPHAPLHQSKCHYFKYIFFERRGKDGIAIHFFLDRPIKLQSTNLCWENLCLSYIHICTHTHTHENKSKSSDWKWRRLAYKNANLNSGFNAQVANTFLVGSFIGSLRGVTIQFYWRSAWWNYFTVVLPNSMNSSQDT